MVERYRRGKGKQKLLGSHQRCWIWGRNVVLETLRAGKWMPLELYLSDSLPMEELEAAGALADTAGLPCNVDSAKSLTRRCRSTEHQGYLAKMPTFPYDSDDDLLSNRPANPLYAVLDAVQDPYNFGAIVRAAEVMGVDAVFVGESRQVEVTSLVARSSAGAVNCIHIARVADLRTLLLRLKELQFSIVGTDATAEMSLPACDLSGPAALIIGNEGEGVTEELSRLCDQRVSVPQLGRVASLNAAVAAGIVFYEATRQRAAP